jgi:hypothetical protein
LEYVFNKPSIASILDVLIRLEANIGTKSVRIVFTKQSTAYLSAKSQN